MNVGFIGLGLMGVPMARRLIAAGHSVSVHSRRRESADDLVGAVWAERPADLAQTDVVITMLPEGSDVERALFSQGGVFDAGVGPGLVVDMSTIGPEWAVRLDERLRALGSSLMDAPVSGGPVGAEQGRLAIMVGGSPADFATASSLFAALGTPTLLGPVGAGQSAKLVNQLLLAGAMAGIVDAFALATRSGLQPRAVLDAVRGGMAGGAMLEWAWPRLTAGDLAPGFKISHFLKDLDLAGDAARAVDLDLELTGTVREAYRGIAEVAGEQGTQALVSVPLGSSATSTSTKETA